MSISWKLYKTETFETCRVKIATAHSTARRRQPSYLYSINLFRMTQWFHCLMSKVSVLHNAAHTSNLPPVYCATDKSRSMGFCTDVVSSNQMGFFAKLWLANSTSISCSTPTPRLNHIWYNKIQLTLNNTSITFFNLMSIKLTHGLSWSQLKRQTRNSRLQCYSKTGWNGMDKCKKSWE